jgi:hypothetical protein
MNGITEVWLRIKDSRNRRYPEVSKKNISHAPLKNVFLPPLHIKLNLKKKYVKAIKNIELRVDISLINFPKLLNQKHRMKYLLDLKFENLKAS